MKNFFVIIPARGGSKGIINKNIKLISGKPLIAWTIENALKSKYINEVYVSTDCNQIAKISEKYGAKVPFLRPKNLAKDDSKTIDCINHMVDKLDPNETKFDYIIILQPTSPLRNNIHINEAIEMIIKDNNADSLVSCVKVPHIFHPESVMIYNDKKYLKPFLDKIEYPTRRQEKSDIYSRNGAAIYITKRNKIKTYIYGGKLICYEMSFSDSVDIDDMNDFKIAEKKLNNLK
mgnify:CR=1 FL=1